jgi:hypothetical protein
MAWNNNKRLIYLVLLFFFFSLSGYRAQGDKDKKSKKEAPIKKINEYKYEIGNVIIDLKDKEVKIPGVVNMDSGIIEYLAVSKMGKDHESILVLDAEPVNIHTGLLLLNIKPGGDPGEANILSGDEVELYISWREKNREKKIRAENLIFNQVKKAAMQDTHWIFNGSVIRDKRFMAQDEKSIVATFYDKFALINNPLSTRLDDTSYEVNVLWVPEEKTPITLIIKKVKK